MEKCFPRCKQRSHAIFSQWILYVRALSGGVVCGAPVFGQSGQTELFRKSCSHGLLVFSYYVRSLLVAFFNATSAVAGHSYQGCGANSVQTDCGSNHRLCRQHELVMKRPLSWASKKKIQENEALASKGKRNMQEHEALASDQNRIQDGKRATTRGERTRSSGPKGWVPFPDRGFGVFFWVWFSFLVQAGPTLF